MATFWRPGTALRGATATADAEAEVARDLPKDVEVPLVQFNPLSKLSVQDQRARLPVARHRLELLYAVETYAITILVGTTGSGKTTQVPQYLVEAGWATSRSIDGQYTGQNRTIVCTQPRRVAVVTIAERVAMERGCNLGEEVGYAVRFEEQWDAERTKIKFVTDGLLLRETMRDPLLSRYSVVILDEAHERNLETDLLLGLIKKIRRKRPELRVIIASATLHVDTFVKFFRSKKQDKLQESGETSMLAKPAVDLEDVVVVSVEGRQFPVDIEYLQEPCGDYLQRSIDTVLAIDKHEGEGDVLVFLPGQEEIDFVVRALNDRAPADILPVPLYGTLPLKMQQNAFLPAPRGVRRKVIVATTIAETSVTIEGVVFVVDGCFTKLAFFNPLTGVETLVTTLVSKASAKQRAGRAGRSCPGKCFRLCTQEYFRTKLAKETIPQMQRTNLATVALYLLSMGIRDLAHFDFVSPPSPEALIRALELLFFLGVIDTDSRLIDPLGTQVAEFPVAPSLAKVILSSCRFDCMREMLSIASVLSVGDVFLNARGSKAGKEKLAEAMEHFAHPDGDHMMYLSIYDEFVDSGKSRSWCDEYLLSHRALVRATEVRRHLERYITRFKSLEKHHEADHVQLDGTGTDETEEKVRSATIRKCLVSGYFANAAKLHADGIYRTLRDQRAVQLHRTSVYYHMGTLPDWIIFHQSVLTTEEFVRDVSKIDPRWLVDHSPDFYRTKDVSSAISGSSGALGLPSTSSTASTTKKPKVTEPEAAATAISSDGRILFRKPKRSTQGSKPNLPVHIGKSKGGLRSQF
uniref:RNA helicase n=1 Tax=Peronospora matthiolae TaxID=2874970 RepID=A0AAV1VCI7_9STRA